MVGQVFDVGRGWRCTWSDNASLVHGGTGRMGGGGRGRMAGLIAGKFDFVQDLGAEGVAAG